VAGKTWGIRRSGWLHSARHRLSGETPAQQIGIQQPLDRSPPRFDLLEGGCEQSGIMIAVGICSWEHAGRRQVGNDCGVNRAMKAVQCACRDETGG